MTNPARDDSALTRVGGFWTRLLRGPGPSVRAEVYRSLATLLEAGFGAREAVTRMSDRGTFSAVLRTAAEEGRPFSTGLAASDGMATEAEVAILEAGERSGHTVEALRRVAERLDAAVAARRRLLMALVYPALVLHVALVLPSIPLVWFPHGFGAWLQVVLLGLLVIWGVPFLAVSFYAAKRDDPGWSHLFCRLPAVGPAVHTAAVARFAWTLAELHDAGILHDQAVSAAGRAAALGWLRRDLANVPAQLAAGDPLPVVFAPVRALPADVRDLISTGDATGTLAEGMRRAGALYDERATRAATAAAVAGGAVTYILAVLVTVGLAFTVVGGYYSAVNDLLNGR